MWVFGIGTIKLAFEINIIVIVVRKFKLNVYHAMKWTKYWYGAVDSWNCVHSGDSGRACAFAETVFIVHFIGLSVFSLPFHCIMSLCLLVCLSVCFVHNFNCIHFFRHQIQPHSFWFCFSYGLFMWRCFYSTTCSVSLLVIWLLSFEIFQTTCNW